MPTPSVTRRIQQLARRAGEPAWLLARRLAAWRDADKLPLPSFKYGVRLGQALPTELAQLADAAAAPAWRLSGDGRLMSFRDAWKIPAVRALLEPCLRLAATPTDAVSARLTALAPITVLRLRRGDAPAVLDASLAGDCRERLFIVAEPGSDCQVVERLTHDPDAAGAARAWRMTEFLVGRGARLAFAAVGHLGNAQAAWIKREAMVAAGARFESAECLFGGSFVASSVSSRLIGPEASAAMRGLFVQNGAERLDIRQSAIHLAPRTRSTLDLRGVVAGQAKAVGHGLIRIDRGAAGCQSSQKAATLLLSDRAQAGFEPTLEIAEADVKCGHGASVGRPDPLQLFYLMSRGLDRAAATRLAVEGFLAPLVAEMRHAGLTEQVSCLIGHRLAT